MSNRFTRELKDPETGRWSGREIWIRVRSGLAVLLSLGVLVGGGWFVYDKASEFWSGFHTADDYEGEGIEPVVVDIPKGSSISAISSILVEAGVVKSAEAFDEEASANNDSEHIQAGRYQLKTQMPAKLALAWLLDPSHQVHNRMTLVEGQRLDQMVAAMAKASKVPAKEFNALLKKWKKLQLPTWARNGAEGFISPDTYELADKTTAAEVLDAPLEQFIAVMEDLEFEKGAKELGITPYQALIVASIIEKEAGADEYRAKVARVIYNRLADGEKLQLDSTVAYAANITGRVSTTDEERKIDSPWNTYVVSGLPKGPISSPSRKSLEAAIHPADGPWKFFVTVDLDTGETEFNETLDQHNASVAKWTAWCSKSDANSKKCYG
jgi:UPF0755 protein